MQKFRGSSFKLRKPIDNSDYLPDAELTSLWTKDILSIVRIKKGDVIESREVIFLLPFKNGLTCL